MSLNCGNRCGAETTSRINTRRGRLADPDRVAFQAFAVTLREELAPEGLLESIYAERVILAAWRLREAVEAERVGVIEGLGADSADLFGRLAHDLLRQSERAERALGKALDALASVRNRDAWGRAAALDTSLLLAEVVTDAAVVSFESDVISTEDVVDDFAGPDETPDDDEPLPRWQDRLVFDENVSADSPTVKGTWVTVSQIVTLVVDGFTWADILRTHPELTEDDLRVCLAFAHEQESDDSRGAYLP
ncbi:MAG TPA: DUF433 domain-containing protein [Isosphaeraceae bacterium]|jgi:uncharacterized protein (DUF433 family)